MIFPLTYQFKERTFCIRPLVSEDLPSLAAEFDELYAKHEPLGAFLKLTSESNHQYVNYGKSAWVAEGLSLVVVDDENSHDVRAFQINAPFSADLISPVEQPAHAHYAPLRYLLTALYRLDQVMSIHSQCFGVRPSEVLCLMLSGCSSAYAGMGLSTEMKKHSLLLAAERGFKMAYAQTASLISQKVNTKVGLSPVYDLPVDEFVTEGIRPFQGWKENPPTAASQLLKLMVIVLPSPVEQV